MKSVRRAAHVSIIVRYCLFFCAIAYSVTCFSFRSFALVCSFFITSVSFYANKCKYPNLLFSGGKDAFSEEDRTFVKPVLVKPWYRCLALICVHTLSLHRQQQLMRGN